MKFLLKLALFVAILGAAIQFGGGALIKTAINTAGPEILGTGVRVESVSLSPLTGNATINNLVIDNPAGFSENPAFALGKVVVDIDVTSLIGDVIRIREISVDAPLIRYERSLKKGTNLDAIQNAVAGDEAGAAPVEDNAAAPTTSEDASSKSVEIDLVSLTNAEVTVAFSGVGATLPLPPVVVKDIGKNGESASLPEAIQKVMAGILGAISKLDTSSVIDGAGNAVKGAIKSLRSLF